MNQENNSSEISRNGFLKLGGAFLLALILEACTSKTGESSPTPTSTEIPKTFIPDIIDETVNITFTDFTLTEINPLGNISVKTDTALSSEEINNINEALSISYNIFRESFSNLIEMLVLAQGTKTDNEY